MPNNDSKTTSGQPGDSWKSTLLKNVVRLAAAWNEPMPEARQAMYVENLMDLDRSSLEQAFRRAVQEGEKFPSIADLRKLAAGEMKQSVEAMAAWDAVQRYVREYGVERMPVYVRGKGLVDPPPLPARIEYALRRIGGLQALRAGGQDEAFPFLLRDFCAAFAEAPVAEEHGLLEPGDALRKALGTEKKLPPPAEEAS